MRLLAVIIIIVAAAWLSAAAAAQRPVGPLLDWTGDSLERFDASWLHLKFVEGAEVDLAPAANASGWAFAGGHTDLARINEILADAPAIRRTFPGDRAKYLEWKARGEAASGQPGPDLSLWYNVQVNGGRAELAASINALNAVGLIEIAHPAPICEPARIVSHSSTSALAHACIAMPLGTPDFTDLQDYLFETPVGLDAPSAWAQPGGRGAGMKFIDVELGWTHLHEDFDHSAQFYQGDLNSPDGFYRDHGTAVVGEVVGMNNGFGITGFASDAEWGTVGIDINAWPTVPQWFMEAAEALDPGDIWLIELQMFPAGRNATPMEYVQVNYDVIWTSSWSLGVVCVEAGANGSQDLDASQWNGLFDRNVRDSGAIMVGAGTPTGRVAESFTNYGSRMDVHAWGSAIVTTGYGDLYTEGTRETEYTSSFGGTSGASPMIVGAGLCLQGIARDLHGQPLTPAALRTLLNKTGIPHLGTRLIGPRPDLAAAIDDLISVSFANLTGFAMITGTLLDGDVADLLTSDDSAVHTQSGFGQTLVDLHHMEMQVSAVTTDDSASSLDLRFESRIDEPAGTAQVRLLNHNTGQYQFVGQFSVGNTDGVDTIANVDATNYVGANGEIELRLKHIVFVPFLAFTFESFIDWVEIQVR